MYRNLKWSLDQQFDNVDSALYNIKDDPEERTNLKLTHPDIYNDLRLVQNYTNT